MARPRKEGLTYFPTDTDIYQDLRIRKLLKLCGAQSIAVYIALLAHIYKHGYYLQWDPDICFIISEDTKMEESEVKDIIICCLELGLFSEEMFNEHDILTSRGIQSRYQIATTNKRICEEYSLINADKTGVFVSKTPQNETFSTEKPHKTTENSQNDVVLGAKTTKNKTLSIVSNVKTPVNGEFPTENSPKTPENEELSDKNSHLSEVFEQKTPQSKRKEKENIKENIKRKNPLERVKKKIANSDFLPAPPKEEVKDFFEKEKLSSSPTAFFDYYQTRGWLTRDGIPISDWQACARMWDEREKKFAEVDGRRRSTPVKSELQLINEREQQKLRESAARAAAARIDNPENLSSAESLARYKQSRGLDPSKPLTAIT